MRGMSRSELIEEYNLTYDEIYDIPEPEECPECGEQTVFPNGSEMYGTDADGRRGVKLYYHLCSECGYEGESF